MGREQASPPAGMYFSSKGEDTVGSTYLLTPSHYLLVTHQYRSTLRQTWVVTHHSVETPLHASPHRDCQCLPAAGTHFWELRRRRLCWWCTCHIPLAHGWVSLGTGGMSFIDRNCIINLDRILTFSWHAIFPSSKKTFGKQVTWNLKLWSSRLGTSHNLKQPWRLMGDTRSPLGSGLIPQVWLGERTVLRAGSFPRAVWEDTMILALPYSFSLKKVFLL